MQGSLERLPCGVPAIVMDVGCSRQLRCRLHDFGLIPGTKIIIRYRSPDKGVSALEFRGTVVAVRTRDLRGVRVRW